MVPWIEPNPYPFYYGTETILDYCLILDISFLLAACAPKYLHHLNKAIVRPLLQTQLVFYPYSELLVR